MNTGEAEPSSGLNARLRPRKSNASSPKTVKTTITKPAADKPKRTSTPSKASPNKPDDLTDKADSPAAQTLCPYCDKTFPAKRALAKHVRRAHLSPSRPDCALSCLFCNHAATDAPDVIRHMVDNHPNQYFACYDCHTRFPSTTELAEHKLNVCEKQKLPYRNKLRQKAPPKKSQKKTNINGQDNFENDAKDFPEDHGFNGIVISCELKSSQPPDLADIEENITTNFILPPGKSIVNGTVIEKNTVIILDELQWSKRIPPNFSFQNTDADQILSRLGVVHRSPRTGESHGKEWLKNTDEVHQKFEKCFDTKFYSKVASNVQENLTKFLDGSCNFNPDPENTIKTRKTKNIVAINTVEGFPILLASEQFLRHGFDAYMPRAIAPKHKWKWDNLENDKSLMSAEQIKRDSHTNNCIISLVSSLDIWTQLCMRRKYDTKFNKAPVQKKTEKQSIIGKELKEILESRELPASSSQVVKFTAPAVPPSRSTAEFPASLGLMPTAPTFELKPAVLSGEWVRPRCYVCCACGAQIPDGKGLSMHIASQHPNAQIQHYEIVGDVLLNSDILKHLYVPPSQMYNRSRPLRGFRECTKCNKSISPEDLHQHMLDCAGDTPTVRNSRKCRHRPFGVRKRRARLPDNTIRKKIRKEVRTRHNRKGHMRPRSRPRTEVGDAETIRKMLADLPAKRHRVMVKPLNPTIRPRRNLRKPRNNMVMRKKITEDAQNSQRQNSSQIDTPSVSAEGKGFCDPEERPPRRPFKRNVKLVASKLLRKKDSFNQKSLNKSKRQIPHQKFSKGNMPPIGETPSPESANDNNIQVDQLSIQNNANRINLNAGSGNAREHGDRSNNNYNRDHANNYNRDNDNNYNNNRDNANNYNRDNENPGGNGDENNGDRDDPLAPAPNAPLKHSIASLTASSETHDKAVQFHQMFLIQQECNNLNQHVAAEQRMLFENEAVVTKLDKPPLHFNPRRPVDLQVIQKIKPLKPKKRLNDCIAMLKNKLDPEPRPPTLPAHVSVQCGNDEPLDAEPTAKEPSLVKPSTVEPSVVEPSAVESSAVEPSALEPNAVLLSVVEPSAVEPNAVQPRVTQLSAVEPAVIERRHSTTEVYTEYAQRSAYMLPPAPKNPAQDNAKSVTSKTRSRRSSSTRSSRGSRSDKTADILTSQEMLQWKQLYYDSQMLNAQSFTENYTKRESSRRRNSLVPRENLLLQHAMNLNLLSQSNELSKLPEYHYPSASTHHQLTRKNSRRDTQKSKANVQPPRSRAKDNSTPRGKNVTKLGSAPTKPSQWSNKSVINTAPTKANNNRQNGKSTRSRNTATTIEKIVDPYPQTQFSEDTSTSLNIEKMASSTSRAPEEHHSQNFSRNTPLVEYTSDIPPTLYPMSVEAPSAPLDLTNKISNQEGSVQYITQEQYPAAECEIYEPLDSLNQNMANLPLDANTQISNEQEVVDLRINTIANRASFESRYTSTPPELITDEIDEENATDLCFRSREDFPTDLSMNRLNYSTSTNSYEKPSESHNHLQTNYIRDYSTPIMHNGRCIVVHECYDENSQRIVMVENEVPTDWSGRRSATRSNMREIEEPMILNVFRNNAEPDDENVPADLTRRNMPSVRSTGVINNSSSSYDSYDSQRAPHYANTGQIINYHYDRPLRTPPESNFTSSSNRTATSYCELSDQFESNSNEFTATRGLSINDTTLNKSTNYAQIDYSHSEMPLSLVSNSVIESTRTSSCTKSNASEYEMTTTDYTLSNEYMSVEKPGPRYSSTTMTTINNTNLGVKTKDAQTETISHEHSPKISEKHNTSSSNKIKTTESKTSSVYNITTTEPTVKTDKEKIEPNKTECLEQDDETARKIAMLPKELVEILGTMPVDHRNQLLKVLPQYVSTSTSPLSHSNSAESVKCKSVTASENSQTTTKPVNQDEREFLFESNSEDARTYKNLQFTESSTISVSSSILLTPPTPKLSERYSLQSSENYDTQTYTRKSRASTEEQTTAAMKVDSNKLCVAPVLSPEEEIKNTTEFNNPDRIIDLTVDENSSENTDVTNMETVIQKHVVTATSSDVAETTVLSKSTVQKTSNDKTASLRAVRIKTPSKRHHSLLPENTVINTQNINTLSINVQDDVFKVQDDISKDSHSISPKAIQQAKVSSTEHCSDRRTSQTPIISPIEKKQRASEEKVIVQKDREDETSTEADKLNLVTSTVVNDMNSNLNKACSTDVSKSNITENPVAAVNVNLSPSKKPDGNSDVNDETETNNDEFTKESVAIEKQAVFDTLYKESSSMKSEDSKFSTYNVTTEKHETRKESSLMEDEDSEDDISLAVILKQKQRDFNSVPDAPKNKECAVNKKKRKTKKQNKTAEVSDSNKNLETSKIKDKNTISEIINDRVCNESNLMDKRACGKKNAKKSKRLHHAQNIHYSESTDQANKTNDYENEINKENNVSSDKTKKLESPEDSFKVKQIDQDPDRSCSVNIVVHTDKNKETSNSLAMNDKSMKMLESCKSSDDISEISVNDTVIGPVIQNKIQSNLPYNSVTPSCDDNLVPQPHDCSEIEKILSSEDVSNISNDVTNSKDQNLKLCEMSETSKDVDEKNSTKSKKDSAELCSATSVNFESEDTNVTPLRRSRRGKSLFIASHSAMGLNLVSQESEQKAPLTKKQLIFSKLLQDEENHNKTSLNATLELVEENLQTPYIITSADDIEDQKIRNTLEKSLDTHLKFDEETPKKQSSTSILKEEDVAFSDTPNSEENQHLQINTKPPPEKIYVNKESLSAETLKTSRRKISSQPKTKSKKKKSFEYHANTKDIDMSSQQNKCTDNKEIQNKIETKETTLHDESTHTIPSKIEYNTKVVDEHVNEEPECIKTLIDFDFADINSKPTPTGKRKSCSPPRQDSSQSMKPKKCKLHDESESTAKDIAPRKNTCYNKPARRARSKSVVVKSSSAEWYDPYDIDLEDMIDKTEPFVRKKISSKMSFSSFKSSIAAKTQEWSNTAPSDVVNILPSEANISNSGDDIKGSENIKGDADIRDGEDVKGGPDNSTCKVDCASENKVDRNVNDLFNIKDDISDSDDSTKSDVPLKKYAEEKEKKLAEKKVKKSNDSTNESNEKLGDKTKARKKNNRSVATSKKEEKVAIDEVDSENDLDSDQFMECFGFYYKKKPRKSNLLATKKISETFHIIGNDSDDVYSTAKERSCKKGSADNKKDDTRNLKGSSSSPTKKAASRSRKKKSTTPTEPPFCHVCKIAFRRSDNLLRHQISLYHVSRLCDSELKVQSLIVKEEPNYLIAYKQQLDKLKLLQNKINRRKNSGLSTSDIVVPTLKEILQEAKRTIREQELSRRERELSRDEALFLDCCEMLKKSHNKDISPDNKCIRQYNSFNCPQTSEDQSEMLEKSIPDDDSEIKRDEEMDAITAKNIMDSEEVRNLENDLISNLKETSGFAGLRLQSTDELTEIVSEIPASSSNYVKDVKFDTTEDSVPAKPQRTPEVKDKMYPDINETIDMFEDKFDKIKRKCRSQAAAAKLVQTHVDTNLSYKNRKKSDKKKGKKSFKKGQNAVPTKGALKGFDGIKVSILTSDINMSAIVPSVGNSFKKKRKSTSKKKRERKSSDVSNKSDSVHVTKESAKKEVDIYEFRDTEDIKPSELRPSTLKERYKSINNKEMPSTSKTDAVELAHASGDSASDGDDFVYMDEFIVSEEETENSVISCETGDKGETKKSSLFKRKDVIEKNAVMGKIFKHNAVRSDKKNTKVLEEPEADFDQLFDSLLDNVPVKQSKIEDTPKEQSITYPSPTPPSSITYPSPTPTSSRERDDLPPVVLTRKPEPSMSVTPVEELISQRNAAAAAAAKYESSKEYCPTAQAAKCDDYKSQYRDSSTPCRDEDYADTKHKSKEKLPAKMSSSTKRKSDDHRGPTAHRAESPEEPPLEEGGVARQRARRKCAVGKQNVLAETWSSESEPDAVPPRPNSAESAVAAPSRRRRPKKREVREASVRRATHRPVARTRPPPLYWSEGEDEPGHPQQHGWIVGDSHKKLVTMLAHAKGRKRSHDDRRPLID